ncbi:MAG: tetratricopeptide repeat protein [Treponema sp.]|jgi:tetratricopeptide (TPR) repeat protein|nr:tetratricopeptide repeat protein [Treponema sp.]
MKGFRLLLSFLLLGSLLGASSCLSRSAASAEEYFSIGMAYFELGKFEEAEKWLNRARGEDKTRVASEYNLGRIAFEAGRYGDAVEYFDRVLKRDPVNVMALRAAAYTRIKTGENEMAAALYNRVLELVPESADDGYNYALVLYVLKEYGKAEEVLFRHSHALDENMNMLLLLARTQRGLEKVEAIDAYARWLGNNTDAGVRYEYAQVLEKEELYAKALEQYREALGGLSPDSKEPTREELRLAIIRLLMIADGESEDGLKELNGAVEEGFADLDALAALMEDARLSEANRRGIGEAVDAIKRKAAGTEAAEDADSPETPEGGEAGPEEAPGETP